MALRTAPRARPLSLAPAPVRPLACQPAKLPALPGSEACFFFAAGAPCRYGGASAAGGALRRRLLGAKWPLRGLRARWCAAASTKARRTHALPRGSLCHARSGAEGSAHPAAACDACMPTGEHATAEGAGAATVPQRRGAGENAHAPKSAKSAHASRTKRAAHSAAHKRAAHTFGFGQCLHAKASRMCTVRALNSHPVRHVCLETSVSTPVSRLALRHVGAASGSSMYSRVSAWHLCGICNALSLLLREHGGMFRNYRQGRLLTAPLVSLRWHDAAARSSWSPAQATDRCESGDAGAPRSASCVQQQWHAAGRGEAGDAGDEVFQVVHAGKAGEATVWPTRADAARWRGAPLSTVLRLWRARAA